MPIWLRLSIGGAATLMVGMGIGRFSYTPLVPALIESGGLSAAEAGAVGAWNLAGFLVGAVAAPWLRARRGEVPSLRLSLWIALLCLFASALPWGFEWLVLWRFLVGAAAGVMMIYSLAIVTRNAPPARLGAATGIVFTGVGAGILLAGAGVPVLLAGGLATAWGGLAVIGALGVWTAFWGLGAADGQSRIGLAQTARVPWNGVSVRLAALQTLFAIGLIPHTIYWIDYQVRGLGHGMAFGGAQWALFGLGAVSGTYLWGRLADRIGFRVGLVLALAALATGVALPVIQPAEWALVLSSIVVGAQPGFSAVLSGRAYQLVGVQHMAGVWRRVTLSGGVGQAIGGYAFVALFTATQSYMPVFLTAAAAMALGAVIAWSLRAPS